MEPTAGSEVDECVAAIFHSNAKGQHVVGVAAWMPRLRTSMEDAQRWSLEVYEFADGDQFQQTESLVTRLKPTRCIIPQDERAGEARKLRAALDCSQVPVLVAKRTLFAARDIESDLRKLLDTPDLARHQELLRRRQGLCALAAVVQSEGLLERSDDFGHYHLSAPGLEQYMRLDAPALQALNVFPGPRDPNVRCSLAGVLDHCVTQQIGSRMLQRWLRHPLRDVSEIRSRQHMVELFLSDTVLRAQLRDTCLRAVPDLDKHCRRLERGAGMGLEHLYQLYRFACSLPVLRSSLEAHDGPYAAELRAKFAARTADLERDFGNFMKLVEETVDMEAVQRRPPEFLINPAWSPTLEALAAERDEVMQEITRLHDRHARGWAQGLDLKVEADKQHGFVFRVNKKHDKAVRQQPSATILSVQKNGVHFTTSGPSGLQALAARHRSLAEEYSAGQQELIAQAAGVAKTFVPVFEAAAALLAELDVLVSFAHAAAIAPRAYVCPTLTAEGTGHVELRSARHPCMELQDDVQFIPNDYTMHPGTSRFIIITGPNMGGKSTYIRQLGTIAVMAQVGSYVPCDSAALPVFDAVMARVGAGDSQLRGVSTFMAEMLEASAIIEMATANSLVIVDELGRGTSTYDGFGLAWAISEHLAERVRAYCLFATHFHELTALANCTAGVTNAHVSAHAAEDNITMLYAVRPGACDQSFGIHVAELAKFPPPEAKRKAAELEDFGLDGSAMPEPKRARVVTEESRASAEAFLRDLARLPLDTMAPEHALQEVQQLAQARLPADASALQS